MLPRSLLDQLDSMAQTSNKAIETPERIVVTSYGHDDNGQGQQRIAAIKNFAVLYITGKLHPVFVGPLFEKKKQRPYSTSIRPRTGVWAGLLESRHAAWLQRHAERLGIDRTYRPTR